MTKRQHLPRDRWVGVSSGGNVTPGGIALERVYAERDEALTLAVDADERVRALEVERDEAHAVRDRALRAHAKMYARVAALEVESVRVRALEEVAAAAREYRRPGEDYGGYWWPGHRLDVALAAVSPPVSPPADLPSTS